MSAIKKVAHRRPVDFAPGQAGHVTTGSLRVYKLLPDGRWQITGFLFAGDFLGLAIGETYVFSAEVMEPSTVCRFRKGPFRALVEHFPPLEHMLLHRTSHELAAAQSQVLLLGRKTAIERVASFLLDLPHFDKELERRGHRFCRYADDCNIYVRSQAAGERVMASVTAFLEGGLRLRVNRQKSAVAHVEERMFLGHRLLRGGRLGLAPKSLARMKDRLRQITRRNRGVSLKTMIAQVNAFTTGWVTYYRHAQAQSALKDLDGWLRRKLRCVRIKQCKRAISIATFLKKEGVPEWLAWLLALSSKGWWRMAGSPQAAEAMTTAWFDRQGLVSLANHHVALNMTGNRRGT